MLIKDVVELAKFSELADLAVKDSIGTIVAFINLGLTELYTRFPLKVSEHIVNLQNNVSYYNMPADFLYYMSVYKEEALNKSVMGLELSVNEEDDPFSVFFSDWKTLQVPASITGSFISVIYVSKPVYVTAAQAVDNVTEIAIPDSLVDALLSYVGYRAHLSIRSAKQSETDANLLRFERNCDKAVEVGVAFPSDSMKMLTRIVDRGFV